MVLQKNIYLQLCAHHKKAFELAEAMLSKTKMQRVICIESEGIRTLRGFYQRMVEYVQIKKFCACL